MMISLLWTLHQFCRAEARHRLYHNKRGKKNKNTMFGVILSPEPDVVLALLFYPLQRKHTLIQTIGEAVSKCQMLALACCVTVCVLRKCQNWVILPLKICIKSKVRVGLKQTKMWVLLKPTKSKVSIDQNIYDYFPIINLTFYKCRWFFLFFSWLISVNWCSCI